MNLARVRIRKGITQDELSRRSGIAASVISHYERGCREPRLEAMRKLRAVLGCTWDELLGK